MSCQRRFFNVLCGISKPKEEDEETAVSKEEAAAIEAAKTSIAEDPFWSRFLNINAVIVLAFACFLIGFFS